MPLRNNIVMIKRARPKRITLTNGRTFVARYRRERRDELPKNVILKRIYKQKPIPKNKRHVRKGRGIGSILKKKLKIQKIHNMVLITFSNFFCRKKSCRKITTKKLSYFFVLKKFSAWSL